MIIHNYMRFGTMEVLVAPTLKFEREVLAIEIRDGLRADH